jgi:hypothetical protein
MCKNVSYKEQGEPEKALFYFVLSRMVREKMSLFHISTCL